MKKILATPKTFFLPSSNKINLQSVINRLSNPCSADEITHLAILVFAHTCELPTTEGLLSIQTALQPLFSKYPHHAIRIEVQDTAPLTGASELMHRRLSITERRKSVPLSPQSVRSQKLTATDTDGNSYSLDFDDMMTTVTIISPRGRQRAAIESTVTFRPSVFWMTTNLLLKKGQQIGHGAFNKVYKATLTTVAGEEKNVALRKFTSKAKAPQARHTVLANLEKIKTLRHPGLNTPLTQAILTHGSKVINQLIEIFPLAEGSVFALINNEQISAKEIDKMGQDCLAALAYLHAQETPLCLADIKPENILAIQLGGVRSFQFCDLDELYTDGEKPENGLLGTDAYRSPNTLTEGRITTQDNIYSLALTWLECHLKTIFPPEQTTPNSLRAHFTKIELLKCSAIRLNQPVIDAIADLKTKEAQFIKGFFETLENQ